MPLSQLIHRSPLVRKQATACRAKWWIHPSCLSWVMMASIQGKPVRPSAHLASASGFWSHGIWRQDGDIYDIQYSFLSSLWCMLQQLVDCAGVIYVASWLFSIVSSWVQHFCRFSFVVAQAALLSYSLFKQVREEMSCGLSWWSWCLNESGCPTHQEWEWFMGAVLASVIIIQNISRCHTSKIIRLNKMSMKEPGLRNSFSEVLFGWDD